MFKQNRYLPSSATNMFPRATFDAAGRIRVGEPTTLGDYKQTGFQRTLMLNNAGNGSAVWGANKLSLSVAGAAQYQVMQSKRVHPYFSGKSQLIEITSDHMQHEENVLKRWGYYSSSVAAPYEDTLDGFWLESDGDDYYLVASRAGTETVRVPSQGWDNWTDLNRYNWQFFSVIFFDFLWLGGAVLRLWVKTEAGFILAHTVNWSGSEEDVFILNPSQPLRVEIRGTGAGGGQLRYVCAQVATEGQIGESGQGFSVDTGTPEVVMSSVDTTYPLIAVRKKAARLEAADEIIGVNVGVGSANDRAVWSVQINPTLSAPLTYADITNFSIQKANGNGTITVTAPGTVIASGPVATNFPIPGDAFKSNFLTRLSQGIDGSMDEYVLCMGLQTSGIASTGYISMKEY